MYDITVVPPEIWQAIFTPVCTDGGRTGLNIALSCKFFHVQSSPVRFYSVTLSSIASVEGFLASRARVLTASSPSSATSPLRCCLDSKFTEHAYIRSTLTVT
ncbi:hypothetical protein C8T65DRAFT_301748 [Cerioporus squamosus]|nr:hypothetical protein C8T65DRAFT_301748 [Cerioporus squamosus]